MPKTNQRGFAHQLVILVVVVVAMVGAVGATVYRRNQSQKSVTESSQQTTLQNESSDTDNKDELKPAETPKTETPTATSTPSSAPTTAPSPAPQTSTTPVKSQQRTIQFTKGGGSQQGDLVVVSANLSETHAGTCTFEFYLNGTLRVGKSGQSEGNKCYMEIPVSEFPKSATYSFKLTFVSNDTSVSATQAPYDITVQ